MYSRVSTTAGRARKKESFKLQASSFKLQAKNNA
jgi:hypothetical protein